MREAEAKLDAFDTNPERLKQSLEHWHALNVLGVPTQLVVCSGEGHVPQQPTNKADLVRRSSDGSTHGWRHRSGEC